MFIQVMWFLETLEWNLEMINLKQTAENFYFNKNIPCDGIVIDKSQIPNIKTYEKGNIAQSAIGQASSVLATPMQMALIAGYYCK